MAAKVHLSIDDVIYSLMELEKKRPDSVFDISFFSFLREMNEKYNACFTLYAFENYAETFFINDVPCNYWAELATTEYIKIGFHGTFHDSDDDTFLKKCANFYSVIPQEMRAPTLRLHKFQADEAMLEALKEYGVTAMLCRDTESRKHNDFPPSYILSMDEDRQLGANGLSRNGLSFIRTDIRIEFFERRQLDELFSNILDICCEDQIISVFTHENRHKDYAAHIEDVCRTVCIRSDACFVF